MGVKVPSGKSYSTRFHRSGYLCFTASSTRAAVTLLMLNSGVVFLRYIKTAFTFWLTNEILGSSCAILMASRQAWLRDSGSITGMVSVGSEGSPATRVLNKLLATTPSRRSRSLVKQDHLLSNQPAIRLAGFGQWSVGYDRLAMTGRLRNPNRLRNHCVEDLAAKVLVYHLLDFHA